MASQFPSVRPIASRNASVVLPMPVLRPHGTSFAGVHGGSVRGAGWLVALVGIALLSACGPTAQEQHLMDQEKCGGFGYQQGTQAFADCMMSVAQQRQAEQAAAERTAAANAAAQQRQDAAIRAAKEQADQDAWNRRTSSNPVSSPNPVDSIEDSITSDMQKMENAGSSHLTQGMNCTTTSSSSGSPNNISTTTQTNCR